MNKKIYTEEFKAQAVAKVLARPSGEGINEVAARLQISPGTLKGWIQAADFSLVDRLLALQETHRMNEEALLGWCRQRGVFARDLAQWREAFCAPGGRQARQQETVALRELRLAQVQLQREMNRKNKALAEAASLRVLPKKFQALWAAEDA